MKMRRSWNVLGVTVLVAVLMLSACSQGSDTAGNTPAANNTAGNTEGSTTGNTPAAENTPSPAAELWNTKFDPPIDFSTNNIVFSDYVYPEGMTATDNMWTRYIKDTYGINVTYKYIANSSEEWGTKKNLFMASGDYPDLFRGNQSDLEQLYAAGKLADLTEVFDKYASPLLKEFYDSDAGRQALKAMTRDGKLLGFPFFRDPTDDFGYIYVRQDWLDHVGLPAPKTIADVVNTAQAFATRDPDGNGQNDTYGFGIYKGLFDTNGAYFSLSQFFYGYHAYPHSWLLDGNGKLVYGSIQPEVRTALQATQDMFKAGLIDKEFGTKDIGMVIEDTVAGKVGLFYGQGGIAGGVLQPHHNKDPDAEWAIVPIVSADAEPAKNYISPLNLVAQYFVPNTVEHPEAVILFANAYADLVFGPNADMETYYTGANGAQHFVYAPIQLEPPQKHPNIYRGIQAVLKGEQTPEDLPSYVKQSYDNVIDYLENGNQDYYWYYMKYGDNSQYSVVETYLDNDMYMRDAYLGPSTKTMIDKWSTLRTMQETVFTKIIMGEPIELFDKYVEDFKSLGGGDITREVNEWYEKNK